MVQPLFFDWHWTVFQLPGPNLPPPGMYDPAAILGYTCAWLTIYQVCGQGFSVINNRFSESTLFFWDLSPTLQFTLYTDMENNYTIFHKVSLIRGILSNGGSRVSPKPTHLISFPTPASRSGKPPEKLNDPRTHNHEHAWRRQGFIWLVTLSWNTVCCLTKINVSVNMYYSWYR